MKKFALIILSALALSACQATNDCQEEENPWLVILGKPLTNVTDNSLIVTINLDGSITGSGLVGLWEERDGLFCRTLTAPQLFSGTECQIVTVVGNLVKFDNREGRTSTWTFSL